MVSPAIVLLPLYIYPTARAWNFVTSSITANPNLQFHIIINPNSGPGSSPYPDSSYVAGISSLNKFSNVKLLGYVHTSYATRSASAVEKDISTYAGWTKYTNSDIHVDGIFFDEVTSTVNSVTNSYMTGLATYTNLKMGAGRTFKTYNPGVIATGGFYNTADMIVIMENDYSASSLSTLSSQIKNWSSKRLSKSSIILHNTPNDVPTQTSAVNQIAGIGLGAAFLSTGSDYDNVSQLWMQFCSEMANPVLTKGPSSMMRSVGRSWDVWSPWKKEVS